MNTSCGESEVVGIFVVTARAWPRWKERGVWFQSIRGAPIASAEQVRGPKEGLATSPRSLNRIVRSRQRCAGALKEVVFAIATDQKPKKRSRREYMSNGYEMMVPSGVGRPPSPPAYTKKPQNKRPSFNCKTLDYFFFGMINNQPDHDITCTE